MRTTGFDYFRAVTSPVGYRLPVAVLSVIALTLWYPSPPQPVTDRRHLELQQCDLSWLSP